MDERYGRREHRTTKGGALREAAGIYMIETNGRASGGSFHCRESSAARQLMRSVLRPTTHEIPHSYDMYTFRQSRSRSSTPRGEEKVDGLRFGLRADRAARIVFDTNFRARGWRDRDAVRAAFEEAFATSTSWGLDGRYVAVYNDEDGEPLIQTPGPAEAALKNARSRQTA